MFYERKKLLTIPATTDLVIITQKKYFNYLISIIPGHTILSLIIFRTKYEDTR